MTTADQAVALQSAGFQRYVSDFQREVSEHAGNPAVRQFTDQVRDAMARLAGA